MTVDGKPVGGALISPVARPVPLRQSVYEAMVELVVGGGLRPGEHLVETDLARQLGVSRQPVREALHRLEAEGWVDLRPNQGAFVHVPTDHEVDELWTCGNCSRRRRPGWPPGARIPPVARLCAIWEGVRPGRFWGRRADRRRQHRVPRRVGPDRGQCGARGPRRHRQPPGSLVLPPGRPGARPGVLGRAPGARRCDRGQVTRTGPPRSPASTPSAPAPPITTLPEPPPS